MFRSIKSILFKLFGEKNYFSLFVWKKFIDIRFSHNTYEVELGLLSKFISNGDYVVDVGANYGHYTVKMAKICGKTGKVFSFEPIPFTNAALKMIVSKFKLQSSVDIINMGVGEKKNTLNFTIPLVRSGAQNTGLSHISSENENEKDSIVLPVECISLDEYFENYSTPISFIKMDIEGAEFFALKGAKKLIGKYKPVLLIEVSLGFMARYNIKEEELLSLLSEIDYKMVVWSPVTKCFDLITQLKNSNVFLIPSDKVNKYLA